MHTSPTEYKKQKGESQGQKIPQKTLITTVKEDAKCKKLLTENIQEIQDTMRRPNLRLIGIGENEDFELKGPVNIFNKIIEENFPNLKKQMPMNI